MCSVERRSTWILHNFKFAMELKLWLEFWATVRPSYTVQEPLYTRLVYKLSTPLPEPFQPVYCISPEAFLTLSPYGTSTVLSTVRQSQPCMKVDRTVRRPPLGREQFLLLMHSKVIGLARSFLLPACPAPIKPSFLPSLISWK